MLSDYFPDYITDVAPRPSDAKGSIAVQINLQTPSRWTEYRARGRCGGQRHHAASDTFWVMRYGRMRDPYGYVWAFGAPLPHRNMNGD